MWIGYIRGNSLDRVPFGLQFLSRISHLPTNWEAMKFGYLIPVAGTALLLVQGAWGTEWVTSEKLQDDILGVE